MSEMTGSAGGPEQVKCFGQSLTRAAGPAYLQQRGLAGAAESSPDERATLRVTNTREMARIVAMYLDMIDLLMVSWESFRGAR
jgi:hypothetical protein